LLYQEKKFVDWYGYQKPRLDEYVTLPERGFTNYLSSNDLKMKILNMRKDMASYFYLPRVIPPNPAELLMNKE
jgi:hypothetical protein